MKIQNKKSKIQKLLILIILTSLFFPLIGLASRSYTVKGITVTYTVTYDGLVPCGKCLNINPSVKADEIDEKMCGRIKGSDTEVKYIRCQLCHLFVMINEVSRYLLFYVVLPIATLLLVIGGFFFLFYAENPQRVESGKKIIFSTVIGLVIIFTAWLIVHTFFTAIGVADWTGLKEGGFRINCPIKL